MISNPPGRLAEDFLENSKICVICAICVTLLKDRTGRKNKVKSG